MTVAEAIERRRTRSASCDRRRVCYPVPVRGTELTIPLCEECVFLASHDGMFA